MKKFLLMMIVTFTLGSHALFAQNLRADDTLLAPENNWEIYGGYGIGTFNTVVMALGTILGVVFTAPIADDIDYSFNDYGVFNLGASYYFGDHVYAGATGTYQNFRVFGDSNMWFASVMAEGGVQYGWSKFKFYHALAAGLGFAGTYDGSVDSIFAFNITWLGIKFRPSDHLWLYAESNLGQKGIIQAGLRYAL